MRFVIISLLLIFISCRKKQQEKADQVYSEYIGKYSWRYSVFQFYSDTYLTYAGSEDSYYFTLTEDKRIIVNHGAEVTHSSEPFHSINLSADFIGLGCKIDGKDYSFSFRKDKDVNLWKECGEYSLFDSLSCDSHWSYFEKVE